MEIITLKNREKRSVLGQIAEEVKLEKVQELVPEINKMKELLESIDGLGLAMPQVGISQRCFIMKKGSKILTVINPKILKRGSILAVSREGCLSVPGREYEKTRPRKIEVSYYNESGKLVLKKLTDMYACIFQHEFDHLDGKLISDDIA